MSAHEEVLALLSAAVVWTDGRGRIQGCNGAFSRLTGVPAEVLLGRSLAEALPVADGAEHPSARASRGELCGRAHAIAASRLLDIEWCASPDRMDLLVYLIQEELEASRRGEERFRLAIEAAPNAMIMIDRGGRIVLANARAEKLFGYARAELLGASIEMLVPHRFRPGHPALRRGFDDRPMPRPMGAGRDLFALRKDGTEVPVEIGLNPIGATEGLVLASIIDITERKRVELEIRERARLEAAQRELETFSYSVAHDLRAPLRHINGFIDMLRKSSAGRLDARGQDLLDKVSNASRKLGGLIDELLEFSRTARADLRKERVNLGEIAREVVGEFSAETKGREVEWKIGELPEALCDPAMMKLVFSNLIGNAVKFTKGRSPAVIELGTAPAPPGELVVFVRDNGAGFDMRFADKLFGIFQRLHRMEDFEGTGIGLANVRRIIAKHGGRTWGEGETGKGAVFYFSLPDKGEMP